MWTIFKLTNLFCILVTAYIWFTSTLPIGPLLLILNVVMLISLTFLPIQFKFNKQMGRILFSLLLLVLWTIYNTSAAMGLVSAIMYLPVFYLLLLPRDYQADLLQFVTKWFAILLIPSLLIYWAALLIPLPSFGKFIHPTYVPFTNYLFYIKTTWDSGFIVRFNAFFLEPGHLAMPCVFLMMANRFDFKKNPWLIVLLISVIFSFSLAGYVLTFIGFSLLKVNTIGKGIAVLVFVIGFILIVQNLSGGDNSVNQLIVERLQYDESKGIKGNNRYFNNTDFEYDKALKSGDYWIGVSHKANMKLIGGAGIKIYILKFGLIGVILVTLLYLSMIPPHPNIHYTLSFLFIVALCFVQNAYPGWYSWLLPYVLGLNLARKPESLDLHFQEIQNTNPDKANG